MVKDSCLRGHHWAPPPFFKKKKMEGDVSFVTANHYRLEHKQGEQCQVRAEWTKYPRCRGRRGEKSGLKETWLTYENSYSWTDKQQTPDAERNTSDGNRLLPCEDWNTTVHTQLPCFLLTLPAFWGKTCFLSSSPLRQILVRLAKHFATEKIRSPCKFVCFIGCVCVCVWKQEHEFWLLLERESPGSAARSPDRSWWKTRVTRFTALGATKKPTSQHPLPLFMDFFLQRGHRRGTHTHTHLDFSLPSEVKHQKKMCFVFQTKKLNTRKYTKCTLQTWLGDFNL